ncbi:PREDICTED: structural maintenance of chromosomes protein 1A-like [Vollenhovia emeryi]|uniref:structural maintenance of chromosomes protein 1A-like n=1 Tax=Vollenhovia emeryi TaxID=411798 RepID=UPI0005F53467|nr:PREDICTED: structural maintenance of chromosomes protein 1A-like [Vollenhovia emeryi]
MEIDGLVLRNKYIEKDIKDTEDEIVNINEELDVLGERLIVLNMAISEIQGSVQNRDKDIKNQEKHVNAIKDQIFVNFCKDINVPNISYYEKNNLRIFKEQEQRQEELKQQYDRIENQLCFENETDIESKMLTWKHAEEQADAELDKVYWQKRHVKITIEQDEEEMSKLKTSYTKLEKNLENVEIKLAQHRSQIDVIGTLYLESQKAHIAVQRKIEQKKIECNTVLKECKMEDFIIPMSEISHRRPAESSTSSSNMESSESCEVFTKIDFSQFPRNICNCTEEDLQDTAKQLNENLTKIENEFENILKPNLKVDEKIDTIAQQIQEINTNLRDCRKNCEIIKTQFELIKAKRYKLFKDCLDRIAAEIDSIYKNLVNDTSAQAIILPDNPEEPYAGNIMYNCIAPSKGFLPLQNLSGGEKSLASLALLFAIQRYKQIPFLIMDEGDAALDNANIKYVIRFIQSQINTMQFITISLNQKFYSGADALVGVTVKHGTEILRSKVITISLNKYST